MSDDISDIKQEEQPVVEQSKEVLEQPQEQSKELAEDQKNHQQRKDAEYNFQELRRQREEDKRRAEENARALIDERKRTNELLELLKQSKTAKTQEERDVIDEELAKLSKDDLATIDNVDKKLMKAHKGTKKEVEAVRQEIMELKAQLEEQRFRSKYPDIEEVLSPENIELLKKEDPEIASMIGNIKNTQEQASLAYKYIKRMLPPKTEESSERKKAVENSKKPISVQALSKQSAIGNAHQFENGLTKELKSQLWKEMQDSMKRG